MKKVFLVTEPDTLRSRPGGPATANIWLEIDGAQFPMLRWNDFVVVIMGWWALALLRLVRNASASETVHFMDGPYIIKVETIPDGMLRFCALKRGLSGPEEVMTAEGSSSVFILDLISQAHEVLNACEKQGWWSNDAEILKSAVEALEAESIRLPS